MGMRNFQAMMLAVGMLTGPVIAQTSFTRGHIFVAVKEPEACDFGGREWIVEIEPNTGDSWVFADSDDGLCVVSGLRFTPDGTKLLAANAGHLSPVSDGGWIQAFNPDGSSEIILDQNDGLARPYGANALAFSMEGNLYLLTGHNFNLLKLSGSSGSATVFADASDGVDSRGALDFAPNGDLFYGRGDAILRFSPNGVSQPFDIAGHMSLVVDQMGNIFAAGGGSVFRYDCENALSEHTIATDFSPFAAALAVSPDGRTVYLGSIGSVYGIDAVSGSPLLEVDLSYLTNFIVFSAGMTVFAPWVFGDVDADGDVDLLDASTIQSCHGWAVTNDCRCIPSDLNKDNEIGLLDWQDFVIAMSGPSLEARK